MSDKLELYTKTVPNDRQLLIQSMKFYAFIHFSINTFTGKEWGSGFEKPELFNPTALDVDQWCRAIKSAEMKGVVITAKHHDGFCLWQTQTTQHSIGYTPYKNGGGDIIKELSEACKRYNLRLGIYLSPWDRNCKLYGTSRYMDFYIEQLTELLTQYGDIFMLWLDGACGAALDGKTPMSYDYDRIYNTALHYQPKIILANQGPDVRWVGNESGIARISEWNVIPASNSARNLACQQTDADNKQFQDDCLNNMSDDMGSREVLENYDSFVWRPAEVDVSIRPGWFYHSSQNLRVKSINKLMKIYYGAVGGNSLLLLNIPPNKKGLFHKRDVLRLKKMGDLIRLEESLKVAIDNVFTTSNQKTEFPLLNLKTGGTYSPKINDKYDITLQFNKSTIDRVTIEEDTRYSQRVEEFVILTQNAGKTIKLYSGGVIGFNKIAIFKPIMTDNLTLVILQARLEPYIKSIKIHKVGGFRSKQI
ncbi:MAG: alpha-L-fucosidase [Christensenellaceae bacterium]|jgi:alpha-L-fucosidase|nr:alpha-L-fucosidase [Christensenellaceae bacterium]